MERIKGFENYTIDTLGNVFNSKGKKLKYYKSKSGYLSVTLYRKGKNKKFRVHRLVALAYIKKPINKNQVNHKNGIKTDNKVENLEWCSAKENIAHARLTGLIIDKTGKDSVLSKKIKSISKDGKESIFYGTRDCQRKTGVDRKYICRVLNGTRNHHKGVKYVYCH